MKLSYTTMATPGYSGVEAIKLARRYGYQGVDLRVSDNKGELNLKSTAREIKELKNAFLSEGIESSGLLCYNKTGSDDEASWVNMTDSILRHLDIASTLGAQSIRILGGNAKNTGDREDYICRTADAIDEAIRKDNSKVIIQLQNHQDSCSVKDALDLIRKVGDSRFGLVFSPDHCIVTDEPLSELYSQVKPVAGQLYISDIIKTQGIYESVLPGRGCLPVEEVYEALGGNEFGGWTTFKWEKLWNPELDGPETALPYFIRYCSNFFGG